ncbi:hypothetical protein HDV03_005550 [Kappamyces sp. JEL0829]|nr:hypothetical protein HDV03_005550 [Kappamyces sp. JEL0829]
MAMGVKVTLQYRSQPAPLERLLERFPGLGLAIKADMTQEEQVKSSIDLAVVAHGPIDVLIVSHGIWPAQDVGVKDMDYDRWQHTMNVNLGGTFLVVKHYLQQLERACQQGAGHDMLPSIVLIGSTAGKFGEAWHADYSCSKTSMMYGLILSLKNEIVRVHPKARINTVSPGWIRTPMAARAMSDPSLLYQALASSPLKKVSEPSDITQAILFLADGTKSGNITGISLDVNAGMEGRQLHTRTDFGLDS